MKRWKDILHNCPYLIVLVVTWLFITIGGIALMIYRDYRGFDIKTFFDKPLFAVIAKAEMNDWMDYGINDGIDNKINNETYGDNDTAQAVMAKADEHEDDELESIADGISELISDEAEKQVEEALEKAIEEESAEEKIVGQTLFITYPPEAIDSIYYSDAGKIALTTEYPYTTVDESYFDDAVFFGDSRTLGISDYSALNADFFCENGMTIYKLLDEKGVVCQNTGEKLDLNQVMQQKKYGKIYIMLGMNELGYGDTPYFLEHYKAVLEQLREWQPDAIIYIQANLHVSREKNNPDTEFNNININDKNAAIATLANGTDVFYLDINPLFTDDEGYLNEELTFDGVHLYADGYMTWRNFLMEHAVIREDY